MHNMNRIIYVYDVIKRVEQCKLDSNQQCIKITYTNDYLLEKYHHQKRQYRTTFAAKKTSKGDDNAHWLYLESLRLILI